MFNTHILDPDEEYLPSEDEDFSMYAEELRIAILESKAKHEAKGYPEGHPVFARIDGPNLVPLKPGNAGFKRLPGSPFLVQI